jgi:hypothetical protein
MKARIRSGPSAVELRLDYVPVPCLGRKRTKPQRSTEEDLGGAALWLLKSTTVLSLRGVNAHASRKLKTDD